jgi:putative ABC transport system permease protein
VALSLLLLTGAGLMMRSFLLLHSVKTGFDPDKLLVARVTNYRTGTRVERSSALSNFHEQVLSRLRALPGVVSAAATNSLPYSRIQYERSKANLIVKGLSSEELKHLAPLAGADVSAGYLELMGVPLLTGRLFDERDKTDSPMVLVISDRTAKTLFPDRDPIGQQMLWGPQSSENPYCTVVGVVGNVKHQAIEDDAGLELYYPYTQYPVTNAYYVVRTQVDPASLAASVRQVVHGVDKNAGIVFTKTMDQLISETLWQRRLWGVLLAVFAGTALLLAAVGIYGVMAYVVTQRTREIGIRMALGARKQDVLSMVLRRALMLVGLGSAIGLGAAFGVGRTISSLLYGVSATDPGTFIAVTALLMVIGLLAAFLPALRASKTDPMIALRCE